MAAQLDDDEAWLRRSESEPVDWATSEESEDETVTPSKKNYEDQACVYDLEGERWRPLAGGDWVALCAEINRWSRSA